MDGTSGLAADGRSLDRLKLDASRDPQTAVRKVAGQFEAMFMQTLLKSMRESIPKSGLLDGGSSKEMYTGMLDQQLAQTMSGRKGGLADVIAKQLSRNMGVPADQVKTTDSPAGPGAGASSANPADWDPGTRQRRAAEAAAAASDAGNVTAGQGDFVKKLWSHATSAQSATGVPAHYVIGQAALESGWGKREIKMPDGSSSHNLFGIKAGRDWQGRTVDVTTTEYVGQRPQRVIQRFRAYDSYADAFKDWASLIGGKERYAGVMKASGAVSDYAQGMQKAGYATDPNYGDKLERTINKTLAIKRLVV